MLDMFEITLHTGLAAQALPIMAIGMLGIFVVTGIIIGIVTLVNKFL